MSVTIEIIEEVKNWPNFKISFPLDNMVTCLKFNPKKVLERVLKVFDWLITQTFLFSLLHTKTQITHTVDFILTLCQGYQCEKWFLVSVNASSFEVEMWIEEKWFKHEKAMELEWLDSLSGLCWLLLEKWKNWLFSEIFVLIVRTMVSEILRLWYLNWKNLHEQKKEE